VRCNGEALPDSPKPGDLAVWDGHVAMNGGIGIMTEARYQYGCRTTTAVMSSQAGNRS
jgi:hypothetical protein